MSDFITCDPKLAEHSPVLLNLLPRELLLHHLDWTYPVVNLVHKVLGEVSKLEVPVSHTSPLPGIHHLHDNLEKCRLTRTIFSNNTDPRLHSCGQIDVGEDNSAFFIVSIGHLAQGENCPRHFLHLRKLQGDSRLNNDLLQDRKPLQSLDSGLDKSGSFGIVPEKSHYERIICGI